MDFHGVSGNLDKQADYVFDTLLPSMLENGTPLNEISVLYRSVKQSNALALAAAAKGIPTVRADNNALIKWSLRLSRFLERAAAWQSGGWRSADPPFSDLARGDMACIQGGRVKFGSCQDSRGVDEFPAEGHRLQPGYTSVVARVPRPNRGVSVGGLKWPRAYARAY